MNNDQEIDDDPSIICRICFDFGEFYLNSYKVRIDNEPVEEMVVEDMLKKFTIFEIDNENAPQLICNTCLQELISSYLFYEKIKKANIKLVEFLENCKNHKLSTLEVEIGEDVKAIIQNAAENDDIVEYDENRRCLIEKQGHADSIEHSEETLLEEDYENEEHFEFYDILDETKSDTNQSEKQEEDEIVVKLAKPPLKRKLSSFQQSDGKDKKCINSVISVEEGHIETRIKKYVRKYNKANKVAVENGSFVVAQFIPSSASIQMEPHIDYIEEEPIQELRTMDYAAVEIKGSKFVEINEEDSGAHSATDGKRVYLCQYCPRAFSSSQFLITHVRKSHVCKYCTKAFTKNCDLFEHIRRDHNNHKCVICDKPFTSNSNLRHHLKKVHGVKLPVHISLLSFKKNEETSDTTPSNVDRLEEQHLEDVEETIH